MELLERKRFFDELEAILSDVAGGKGRFVLVSGEAGIGKTTLVERFADANKQNARVLWGACDALFTPRPLGPLYDIAHQTRGRLTQRISPRHLLTRQCQNLFLTQDRLRLFGAVVDAGHTIIGRLEASGFEPIDHV